MNGEVAQVVRLDNLVVFLILCMNGEVAQLGHSSIVPELLLY